MAGDYLYMICFGYGVLAWKEDGNSTGEKRSACTPINLYEGEDTVSREWREDRLTVLVNSGLVITTLHDRENNRKFLKITSETSCILYVNNKWLPCSHRPNRHFYRLLSSTPLRFISQRHRTLRQRASLKVAKLSLLFTVSW